MTIYCAGAGRAHITHYVAARRVGESQWGVVGGVAGGFVDGQFTRRWLHARHLAHFLIPYLYPLK